jgi:hypothetical protein
VQEIGIPLLERSLKHIEKNLELWEQEDWGQDIDAAGCPVMYADEACGTRHCLAGWGVRLAGGKFRQFEHNGKLYNDYHQVALSSIPEAIQGDVYPDAVALEGHVSVDRVAAALFGLPAAAAAELFESSNTLGALRLQVAQHVAKARGETRREPPHPACVYGPGWGSASCKGHDPEGCPVHAYLKEYEYQAPRINGNYLATLVIDPEGAKIEWKPLKEEPQ